MNLTVYGSNAVRLVANGAEYLPILDRANRGARTPAPSRIEVLINAKSLPPSLRLNSAISFGPKGGDSFELGTSTIQVRGLAD